jgi:hypothetical protein
MDTSSFNLLSGLAGGGILSGVIAGLFILFKCFQGRKCKSHSGCIDLEIQNDTTQQTIVLQPTVSPTPTPQRTPTPSVDLSK